MVIKDFELIVISLIAISGTVITIIPERFPQGQSNAGHHRANCFWQLQEKTGCPPGDCPCVRPKKCFASDLNWG